MEETIIMPTRLPDGQDWAWHPDLNLVEISDRLDEVGIMVALSDLQAQWRRTMIRLVPGQRPQRRASGNASPPSYAFLHNDSGATQQLPLPGSP